jgi:hypothetical protein
MKIKITPQTLNMLKANLRKTLMIRDNDNTAQLYVVAEFDTIEEETQVVTKGTWFRDEKITKVNNIYLTHVVMETMHPTGKFLGTLSDEACERFVTWNDLYRLRNQWLHMVEQINHMGFELTRIEKPEAKPTKQS